MQESAHLGTTSPIPPDRFLTQQRQLLRRLRRQEPPRLPTPLGGRREVQVFVVTGRPDGTTTHARRIYRHCPTTTAVTDVTNGAACHHRVDPRLRHAAI